MLIIWIQGFVIDETKTCQISGIFYLFVFRFCLNLAKDF